jgi:hypothetical protein
VSRWRTLLAGMLAGGLCALSLAAPVATSADGRWRIEGRDGAVLVFDGERLAKTLPAQRLGGDERASIVDVAWLPARRSFVIAFDTVPELWELSVDPQAPPVHDGLVHDYRMGEAIAAPGFLGVRRTPLEAPVRALAADARGGPHVLAQSADGAWLLINLDVRRAIARYVIYGARMPDPTSRPDSAIGGNIRRIHAQKLLTVPAVACSGSVTRYRP